MGVRKGRGGSIDGADKEAFVDGLGTWAILVSVLIAVVGVLLLYRFDLTGVMVLPGLILLCQSLF